MTDAAYIRWKPTVKREESVLFGYYVLAGLTGETFASETGLTFRFGHRLVVDHQVYMDSDELDTFGQLLSHHPTAALAGLAERCQGSCDRLLRAAKLMAAESDPSALSNDDLLHRFQRYSDAVIRHAPFLIATLGAESVLERMVRPKIASTLLAGLSSSEEGDAYVRLFSPAGQNYITRDIDSVAIIANVVAHEPEELQYHFQGDRNELLLRLDRDHNKLHYLLDSHHREFCWLNRAYYLGELSTKASLVDRIGQRIAEGQDLQSVVVERAQRPQVVEAELASMLARTALDSTLIEGLQLYRRYLFLRTHRLDCYSLADYWMGQLLGEISARIGLSYDEFVWLTHPEIELALRGHLRLEPGDFTGRRQRHALMLVDNSPSIQPDTPSFELPNPPLQQQLVVDAGLPGVVAFPGMVTGRARIVQTPEDASRINRGDILVAQMTTPDLVVAMERAAAFVTDEGGVACHAALIARDLRTPCLIDTKIATSWIAEGDLVQVDTNSGHVRIIERAR